MLGKKTGKQHHKPKQGPKQLTAVIPIRELQNDRAPVIFEERNFRGNKVRLLKDDDIC